MLSAYTYVLLNIDADAIYSQHVVLQLVVPDKANFY